MDNKWLKNGFVYLVITVAILAIIFTLFAPEPRENTKVSLSEFIAIVQDAAWTSSDLPHVIISDNRLIAEIGERRVTTLKWDQFDILEALHNSGVGYDQVDVSVQEPSQFSNFLPIIGTFLPILIFGGILLLMMRQAQGSNNQALSFGKSKARVFKSNNPTITFAEVAGVEEAKEELQEVVAFLKYPERFQALGAQIPKGVLLVGPPGTGKTHISRAVAGEAGVPFFSISGSEFVEMFVGVGASRVRDLFDQAKRNAPCIVFIDEIDAVGRQRGAGLGGSHDEREQTLNQILVELDGFESSVNVIVLAATNRPDVLDPALLRPGRFDRQVVLDRPDVRGREHILQLYAKDKPLAEDLDLETIARQTPGFSGADLKNLLNEAALLAARRNKKAISQEEVEEAVERVLAGPERRSRIISPREKKVTAFHEVGHALVAQLLPDVDPVHKISIVARGRAGGYTRVLPPEDRHLWTRSQFRQQIAFALGGYVAEVLVFGEMTTGASNDIEMATSLARRMVMEYGMSEKLGPRAFGRKEELIFLGRDIQEQRNYSEAVAQEIDGEVEGLIQEAHDRASSLLTKNKDKLVEIADTLIEVETFDGKAFSSFFEEKPEPSDDVDTQAASTLVDNEDQQPASPPQDSDDSAEKPRTRPYPGMAT